MFMMRDDDVSLIVYTTLILKGNITSVTDQLHIYGKITVVDQFGIQAKNQRQLGKQQFNRTSESCEIFMLVRLQKDAK